MPDSRQNRPWQFSLRALMVVVTLMAPILAIAHYCLDEAEFLRLVFGIAVLFPLAIAMLCVFFAAPLVVVIWLDRRSRRK